MHLKREHPKAKMEHPQVGDGKAADNAGAQDRLKSANQKPAKKAKKTGINWENIYLFLHVAREGSFRGAALKLDISFNKIRRRMQDLEKQVGFLLVTRHVEGVQLTEEGRRLLKTAEHMEQISFDGMRLLLSADASRAGVVRISSTEGLGMLWIMPAGISFQRENPGLIIDLSCQVRENDLLRMQSDIGVMLQQPQKPDLICVRLASLHLIPFAAKSYIEQFGKPKSLKDIAHHRIIEQKGAFHDAESLDQIFSGAKPEGFIALRANTSSAYYLAVVEGAGIGMLPSYAATLDADLTPLDLGVERRHDIWMSCHADAARIARVRLTMDWLKKVFDSRKYPWFRDEFIHPDKFRTKPRRSRRPSAPL